MWDRLGSEGGACSEIELHMYCSDDGGHRVSVRDFIWLTFEHYPSSVYQLNMLLGP